MATFNYSSPAWRNLRQAKTRLANWTCEACGRNCLYDQHNLIVHHKLAASKYPEHALDMDHLAVLCRPCHEILHCCVRYPYQIGRAHV